MRIEIVFETNAFGWSAKSADFQSFVGQGRTIGEAAQSLLEVTAVGIINLRQVQIQAEQSSAAKKD